MKSRIIDCRSDTITKPNEEMKKAMFNASVGDDVYGEDPTVNELEKLAAALFGKEAAKFVLTGTMGNLSSVMAHCSSRGQEVILGDLSHIHLFEQGGIAQIANVHSRTVCNTEDGTFCLAELRNKIRSKHGLLGHYPSSALICLENTHNWCYGAPIEPNFVNKVCQIAKSNAIKVHVDGARIFNAAVSLDIPVAELVKNCDSISMCLSKGLCCPVGSLVIGDQDFIQRVHRCRKVLGGGTRQAGYVAAAGIYALKNMVNRLADDHKHAEIIARAFNSCENGAIRVDLNRVKTNILFVDTNPDVVTANEVTNLLVEPLTVDGESIIVKANATTDSRLRIVTHADISDDDVDLLVKKIKIICEKIDKQQPRIK